MNRQDRRRQLSTLTQRPDAGQRFAADLKVATGLHKEGRLKEAVQIYRKIVKVYEDLPEVRVAWSNLGAALQGMDKLDEAVVALKKARALNPGHPPPHHNLGMALLAQGKTAAALDCLEQAIMLDPAFREPWVTLVSVCQETGDPARIEELCRTILADRPDQYEATLVMADLHRSQGRFAEAEDGYRRCLALQPLALDAHVSLATLQAALGEPARGVEMLLDVLRQAPQLTVLRQPLTELLVAVRAADPARAVALAEGWVAAAPADEVAVQLLAALKDQPPAEAAPVG